ncbi:MAG: electron transport complex subunit RsxC [Rhodothermales bacterium]|nr:electron transport complex subunit RsxC [Rhodothermales bacterium]
MSGSAARTFKHGVHPGDFKELTRELPVERVPLPAVLTVPLSQHLGAPSVPLVKVGDYVRRGQLIGKAGGYVSANLHAPCSGTVRSVGPAHHPSGKMVESVVIERDAASAQVLLPMDVQDWRGQTAEEIVGTVAEGGFVGLGGAAFPTHVKLTPPEGKHARFLIVNAAECEPYLNSDYRILLEQTEAVIEGIQVLMKALGAEKAFVGTEDNKTDAAEHLRGALPPDLNVEVLVFETKYPQGAEKMLIDAVLHREVPSGRLPIDLHVVVNNVGTVAGVGQMYLTGQPLIERVVTVTGPGIRQPRNLLVPVGTPLEHVIDHCGGMTEDTRQILFGGPMMGQAQRFLDVPVMKGTSGILFLTDREVVERTEYACIKCLRCVDACPVFLNPSRLGALAKARLYEDMLDHHIMDCMECASCSFVCPSNIPLVQRFRVAKGLLKEQAARDREREGAK